MSPRDDDTKDPFLGALDEYGARFDVHDAGSPPPLGAAVREVRRRRGRLADDRETGFRDLVLVEHDGVLLWQTAADLGGTRGGGGMRRAGRSGWRRGLREAKVLREVSVPVLEPNQYLAALARTDGRLNAQADAGVRFIERKGAGFAAVRKHTGAPLAGRTLLLVHGTFSSSANTLAEFGATPAGVSFLDDALRRYDGQVLVFDHPTLSVSPFLNAMDLAQAFAGSAGQIDVVAHSRGGLVVQWWLEVFGMLAPKARVRAVLVGSPLQGTSLASPRHLQPVLSVLTNVGSFVGRTMKVAAAANPFALAGIALLEFLGRRERNRWGLPPIEGLGSAYGSAAAVAIVPGLQGQSAVANNQELARLHRRRGATDVAYYAVTAEFEPERIGWKLWKVVTEFGDRAKDAAMDAIFPGANGLVVDTAHMTILGADRKLVASLPFGAQAEVHHCNYFRQPETIAKLREWFDLR